MSWKDFLAASMRLVDLYDANREPGNSGIASVPPSRARKVDEPDAGMFFEIGAAALETLDSYEEESPGTYILAGELLSAVRMPFPECTEEDFEFVLTKLSLRYPLYFAREKMLLKDTALVERAMAGHRYRLSAKGRVALTLADAAEDWLYSDLDAEKIMRAIARGDFGQVYKYTISLAQTIKEASIQVVRMLELPSSELKHQALYSENSLYSGTVSRIQKTVLEAGHYLSAPETESKIDNWVQAHPEDLDVDALIKEKLTMTLSTIEALSRKLSDVINCAEKGGLNGVRAVPFQEIARRFALEDKFETAEEVLGRAGLWEMPESFGSIRDTLVPIVMRATQPKPRKSFECAERVVQEIVRAFIGKYGEAFLERLRQDKLPLSEVFSRGMFGATNVQSFGEVAGVFVDAEDLGFERGSFRVRMGFSVFEEDDIDFALRVNELYLEYVED